MSKYLLSTKSGIIIVFASLILSKSSVTLKMALDTGATYTIIPVESAIAIGCDPIKSHKRIEITTGSGVEYVPIRDSLYWR